MRRAQFMMGFHGDPDAPRFGRLEKATGAEITLWDLAREHAKSTMTRRTPCDAMCVVDSETGEIPNNRTAHPIVNTQIEWVCTVVTCHSKHAATLVEEPHGDWLHT